MERIIIICVAAIIFAACGGGDAKKVQDMNILNIDDLQKDYRASKDTARTKYDGKEFVVLGKADSPIGEFAVKSEDGKYVSWTVRASEPGGMNCWVPVEDKSKFDGVARDSVIAVKGTIYIKDGSFEMRPCTRDFRDTKK